MKRNCLKCWKMKTGKKQRVHQGEETAQFWLSYMDKVWTILQFQRATKENNFELHLASLEKNVQSVFQL